MKKQLIFVILIILILTLLYSIVETKYNEYKKSSLTSFIERTINDIKEWNITLKSIIEYKSSPAYINKVLKEQQSKKNKWEKVIYIISENKYNKFTKNNYNKPIIIESQEEKNSFTSWMTIYQKWVYFLFKKDLRGKNI
jgi:hypothetical protein